MRDPSTSAHIGTKTDVHVVTRGVSDIWPQVKRRLHLGYLLMALRWGFLRPRSGNRVGIAPARSFCAKKCVAAHSMGMREVTYRTFLDGTLVVEVITTSLPIVQPTVAEPDETATAA